MSARMKLMIGVAAIDAGIKELKGVIGNVNDRVQALAVSIINHDLHGAEGGEPTGDCSRALKLVKSLPNSFRREYLIGWFSYFGNIGIDVKGDKVRHHQPEAKRFRKPDLEAAKANNWYEAVGADGKRADWYQGPTPAAFESNTIGDFGVNVINFGDRLLKQLDDRKDDKPVYDLTADERKTAETVIAGMKRLGTMLAARERVETLSAEVTQLTGLIKDSEEVLSALAPVDEPEVELATGGVAG